MASNPHVDLSGDIRDFRRVLSWALAQDLYDLEKELDQIKLILYPEEEETPKSQPQVQSYTPDADVFKVQSGLKVVGHIDLTQFDPKKGKRRERISGGKVVIPSYYLSSEEAAEVIPERKALLKSFLRNAAEDASFVRDCFLLRSTLQYAVIRKEIFYLDCDYSVIRPFGGVLPSSDEMAEFLVDSYRCARKLTRDILTMLAGRHSALPLLDAVCDNPFIYGKNPDLDQAKKVISDAIVGLGSGQVAFRKDMGAIMIALDNHVLRDLGSYIFTAKKISRSDLSYKVFPLNEDKIEMLQFVELEFSTKDEYLKALTGALDEAEEEGLITQNERRAIYGDIERTSFETEQPYIEPDDEDKLECFPGLKPALRNMAKIRRIAEITADAGCIEKKDIPLFIFRLSGNGRPNNLDTISWKPKYSDAPKHKTSPGKVRNPNEFYFLLHHMYEGRGAENKDIISRFFAFDEDTAPLVIKALTYKSGPGQMAKSAPTDFRRRLHNEVDPVIFPYKLTSH